MNLDRRLLQLVNAAVAPFVWTVLGGLSAGILAIFQARLLSRVITRVFLQGQALGDVMPLLWVMLAIIAGRGLSTFAGDRGGAVLARQVKTRLRGMLADKIFRLGPLFTRDKPAGELSAVLLQGVDALDAYFSQFLPQIVLAGLVPLAVLALVFPVDWISGVILLLTGPLIPFFMFLIGSSSEKLTQRQFKALGRMSAFLLDTIQGLRALKELGRSREQVDRIREVSERYRETTMQVLRITFLSALALEILGTISTAVIAVQIGLRLLYGQMGFEGAFFVLLIAPDFYLPLRNLGLRFHASMSGASAARSIFAILDEEEMHGPPVPEKALAGENRIDGGMHQTLSSAPQITFEGITFGYPGRSEPAVSEVSFTLQAGSLVALVGASGAGKTSLLSLLARFIEPQAGQIWVNGERLSRYSAGEWRRSTAWVGQQPYLFSGSIADNLRIANEDARDEQLLQALQLARLDAWVASQPGGLSSQVGEGGRRLSAGQAQRLALARAFLRDAPLVLMDEPTAHLDPPEEAVLEHTVRDLCADRTTLIIAHRLNTIVRADQILVVEAGRMVERGRHSELLALNGRYAALVHAAGGQG